MSDERMIRVDNLKLLMKSNSLSKAELAKMLGTSDSYVSKLLSGKPGTFGEKAARKVEERFKKSRFWLDELHPQGEYSPESLKEASNANTKPIGHPLAEPETSSHCKLLPVIKWEQLSMLQYKNTDPEIVRLEHVNTESNTSDRTKWLEMAEDDTSMGDRLPPKTRILVEPLQPGQTIPAGSFVVISLNAGEHMVRRYKHVTKDRFIAEPLNPGFATLDSADTPMTVVGLVKQALIKF